MECEKRSPQNFDQFVDVRLGLFVASFSRALMPCESQQNHFREACVETPAGVPGLCAETPTLCIFCEREQRTVFDLVEDTFVARFWTIWLAPIELSKQLTTP